MPAARATPAAFRAAFPELLATPDATVDAALAASDLHVFDTWGEDRERGELLYAAHRVTLDAEEAARPDFRSVGSGAHRVDFGDPDARDTGFTATAYGRDFLVLRRRYLGAGAYAA